jgi:hypothetical protein
MRKISFSFLSVLNLNLFRYLSLDLLKDQGRVELRREGSFPVGDLIKTNGNTFLP